MNEHSQYLQANFGDDMIERIHGAANEIDKLERERDEALEDVTTMMRVANDRKDENERLRKAIEDAPCPCFHIVTNTGEKYPIPGEHLDLHDPRCWKREALGVGSDEAD